MRPVALLIACSFATLPAAAATKSPYAGVGQREIKALSAQEMDDLAAGRGMGMALPAELNSYPGPRHVLDHAAALDLTPDQRQRVEALFREMQHEASALGHRILARERALDRLFADGSATVAKVELETAALGRLYGRLRHTHLRYHLLVRALLSERQIAAYNAARGYGTTPNGPAHDRSGRDHRHGH